MLGLDRILGWSKMSEEHDYTCSWPKEPCNCGLAPEYNSTEAKAERKRRKAQHKNWCNYPRDPCDCGADPIGA